MSQVQSPEAAALGRAAEWVLVASPALREQQVHSATCAWTNTRPHCITWYDVPHPQISVIQMLH